MNSNTPELKMPPQRHNPQGEPRRVGVELEMNGISLKQLAHIVASHTGGTAREDGRYQYTIDGDPAGDWIVELDFNLLKEMGREEYDSDVFTDELKSSAESMLRWVAESLVPLELVSPPLPMTRLHEVEQLIHTLRNTGAKGTSDSATNAFGMQFNPEVPSEDPATLTAYLKAFLCLYDWLYKRARINFTRRLTAYVDPFPAGYVRQVIDPAYQPNLNKLIDDYLLHNPTRNRALDLLPLFMHLDEERVRRTTKDPLIKPRPAFHYRLPDCEIDRTDWGLHISWDDWIEVEQLADDSTRLRACCEAYNNFLNRPLQRFLGDWANEVEHAWIVR